MVFNFSLLFRVIYKGLFKTRGTHARLTPKRIFVLLTSALLYGFIEIAAWIGFFLDDIFFPGYRKQEIRKPIFILGPPRSGTTYLHRLLAQDESRFSSMKLWEIWLAPSVTQKKFFKALGALDTLCGSPLYGLVSAIEKSMYKNLSGIHPTSLFEADEDNIVLMHIFSSGGGFLMLPFLEEFRPYFYFDEELPAPQRKRIMEFYKRCVQRHLYVFGKNKQFLSKNPIFSTLVQSLNETFPDAKFVYIARTPFETIPSALSLTSNYFNSVMSPLNLCPFIDEQIDIISRCYNYPLMKFQELPLDRQRIIRYTDLVEHPTQTVSQLCAAFGLEMNPAYTQLLEKKQGRAQRFTRNHEYSLEKFGLTREVIIEKCAAVFDRFGFEKNV